MPRCIHLENAFIAATFAAWQNPLNTHQRSGPLRAQARQIGLFPQGEPRTAQRETRHARQLQVAPAADHHINYVLVHHQWQLQKGRLALLLHFSFMGSIKDAIFAELGLLTTTPAPLPTLSFETQGAILFAAFVGCVALCVALGAALFGACGACNCCPCLAMRVCWKRCCCGMNEKLEGMLE
jgi:hypothetical protein